MTRIIRGYIDQVLVTPFKVEVEDDATEEEVIETIEDALSDGEWCDEGQFEPPTIDIRSDEKKKEG